MSVRYAGFCLFALITLTVALAADCSVAFAAGRSCPPDALGVSRVLTVDPGEHHRIGSIQYLETLPLANHEVVLTFDDGPQANTSRVLDALAAECVKATFFVIGNNARRSPQLIRREHDEGHSVGSHSQTHPLHIPRLPADAAQREIADGFASVDAALGASRRAAPFFRFPALNRTQALESYAASRRVMVWSADIYADDWLSIAPSEIARRPLERLELAGKGIVLFHDIHARTAAAMPEFLRGLKRRGFRVVHVVAASAGGPKIETVAAQWRALDPSVLVTPPHMHVQRH